MQASHPVSILDLAIGANILYAITNTIPAFIERVSSYITQSLSSLLIPGFLELFILFHPSFNFHLATKREIPRSKPRHTIQKG